MDISKATSLGDIQYEDVLDLRDLAEAHADLAGRWVASHNDGGEPLDEDERALLVVLDRFDREEMDGDLAGRAEDEPILIRDSHFTNYAEGLAEDIGLVDPSNTLHGYVDWERFARDLQMDYAQVELGGVTFWHRA